MRNGKRIIAIALPAAVIAIFGVQRVVESPKSQTRIATRPVVVALMDIAEGRTIERASIALAQYPVGTVPAGSYSAIDSIVGRVAIINIYKGEAVVRGRLAANVP